MTRFGVVSMLFRAWIWCNGHVAIANEKEETVSFQECIYTAVCTAIALQSIHLFQSLLQQHCIFSYHQTNNHFVTNNHFIAFLHTYH